MKTCSLLTLLLSYFVVASVGAEDRNRGPATETGADANRAVAQVTGKLICAHCELGIGNECCSAIKIQNAVFILAGKANEDLIEQRFNGTDCRVLGRVAVVDGLIKLTGVEDKDLPKAAKPQVVLTGRLAKTAQNLILENDKHAIQLTGPAAERVEKSIGKWIEVTGELNVDRKGNLRLTADSAKNVASPPKLPTAKK